MSAFNYSRLKATADRLIARFGQSATLVRSTSTGPAYNPTAGAPGEHAVTIVVQDYDERQIDGKRILATDKKVLLAKAGLSITPAPSDKLVIGGVEHSLISPLKTVAPGGVVVVWELQCRR